MRTTPNGAFGPFVVLPGTTTSVVAWVPSAADPLQGTLGVFDDGVPRAATLGVPSSSLVAGPPNIVFGAQTSGLTVLQVSAGGIVELPYGGLDGPGGLYANGSLYGGTGVVTDMTNLAAPTRLGQFPYEGAIALRDAQHLLMLTPDPSFPSPLNGPTLRVLPMDGSFAQTGAVTLPLDVAPLPDTLFSDLVYAGDDAAAFLVVPIDGPTSIAIVHESLVATEVGSGTDSGDGGAGADGGDGGSGASGLFPLLSSSAIPGAITAGADDNLWFTEGNRIGRMTMTGVTTDFFIPTADGGAGEAQAIVAGPDGNLWFTQSTPTQIGRMTPAGALTEFPLPSLDPIAITAGPDGNLWFTEGIQSKIGRMTPQGAATEFPMPTPGSLPSGIAAGPDGNLWVTESTAVARVTTAGAITEFPLPTGTAALAPITAGPDGNLWFLQSGGAVCRLTTAGAITCFPIPPDTPGTTPVVRGIAAGPDGNVWVCAFAASSIWRVTPAGTITAFPGGSAFGIAAGADKNLWITMAGNLMRVSP